ncbi:MAG: hypothetical protein AB7O37_00645 [Vicinamibacteria bacterium]
MDQRRLGLVGLLFGAAAAAAYLGIGSAYYDGFRIPHGLGMAYLMPAEINQIAHYALLGLPAALGCGLALHGFGAGRGLLGAARAAAARPQVSVGLLALFTFAACAGLGRLALRGQVTTDDENTYRFIAQTLRTGSLTAPSPGADLEFFQEQFVVTTGTARYGKYTIGHPLLLALGQALGMEGLVVPLLTALGVPFVWWLGGRLLGAEAGLLGATLLALSPAALLTGATYLSQPTSTLALLAGLACLLAPGTLAAVLAGAAFGFATLARPLPGALWFALAAVVVARRPEGGRQRARELLALFASFAAVASVVVVVNALQSGNALESGQQAFHRPGRSGLVFLLETGFTQRAVALLHSLLRFDGWFLGWPFAAALAFAARRDAATRLLWGFVGVTLAYRLLVPKVGVGGTGSIYLHEALPLLCLLVADGTLRLARQPARLPLGLRFDTSLAACLLAAGALASATLFLPARVAALSRMAEAELLLPSLVARANAGRALVFHRGSVPSETQLSWAYYPRHNSPSLDDDVLYLRLQPFDGHVERNVELWRRRYPDRSAWVFTWTPEEGPRLEPLLAFVRRKLAPSG